MAEKTLLSSIAVNIETEEGRFLDCISYPELPQAGDEIAIERYMGIPKYTVVRRFFDSDGTPIIVVRGPDHRGS